MSEKGDQDVRRKLRQDFDQKGVNVTDAELSRAMGEFLASAVAAIEAEAKKLSPCNLCGRRAPRGARPRQRAVARGSEGPH